MPKRKFLNRIANVVPSKDTQSDWKLNNALGAGLLLAAAPPTSKDLRESWWKVGDQGLTGACVGWATAEGVLRHHFVKANRISQNENLSPRFIWMAAKERMREIEEKNDGQRPIRARSYSRGGGG